MTEPTSPAPCDLEAILARDEDGLATNGARQAIAYLAGLRRVDLSEAEARLYAEARSDLAKVINTRSATRTDVPAMAAEIKRLRDALGLAIDNWEASESPTVLRIDAEVVARLRALIPAPRYITSVDLADAVHDAEMDRLDALAALSSGMR